MRCFDLEIYNNKFETKDDLRKFTIDILKPIESSFIRSNTRIHIANKSTGAMDSVSQIEGFTRTIWGAVALDNVDKDWPLWQEIREGLINGTNPDHKDYFGDIQAYDQRIVETAAIGYALVLRPECIYEPLSSVEKKNLYTWLDQVNEKEAHNCNWKFFRVMVNIGFKSLGLPYNKEKMNAYLDDLDAYYVSDGWYKDGDINQAHGDYYIPFAMHYYGLFYSMHMKDVDPVRAEQYTQRAALFAEEFVYWFAENGAALPYGRSLAYRFAQGAFWSMLVVADVKTSLSLGSIKGIIMRHLRWWNEQPIYDASSRLTIGYAYDNSFVVEEYIGPGSVYWCLKTMAIATLPEDHDFWSVAEEPIPELPETKVQKPLGLVIKKDLKSRHILAYNGGNYHTNDHMHVECKYEKFVYSTIFGFSVPRSHKQLGFGAFDSTLAISSDGRYYRHKDKSTVIELSDTVIKTVWSPYEGVGVDTYLLMGHPWHIRIHVINSDKPLYTAEGGFAIGLESMNDTELTREEIQTEESATVITEQGYSYMADLTGNQKPEIIKAASNTNIMNPRTLIPTLKGSLQPGKTILASYVSGDNRPYSNIRVPKLSIVENSITITNKENDIIFKINI